MINNIRKEKRLDLFFSFEEFQQEFLKNQSSKAGEFQQVLECQQKLKLFYGNLSKKQLNETINKAKKLPGLFAKNFFSLMEQRLDVILYRSGFAKTLFQAKQYCFHGKILVNNFVCKSPGTTIKPGDIVSLTTSLVTSLPNQISFDRSSESANKLLEKVEFNYSNLSKQNNTLINLNPLIKKNGAKDITSLVSELISLRLSNHNQQKRSVKSPLNKEGQKERTLYHKKMLILALLQDLDLTKRVSYQLKKTISKKNNTLATNVKKKDFMKTPLNMEISRLTSSIVYLFSPQRVVLPFIVDTDIVRKIFNFTTP